MQPRRIGIIGGGPGGLMTAYHLEKYANYPIETTIYEASHRIGGKVSTLQFKSAPVTYEAGAAELYDYSVTAADTLKEFVEELGLSIQPMGGSAVVMQNKWIGNLDDYRREYGQDAIDELLRFHRNAKDQITPFEFYAADHPEGLSATAACKPFTSFLDMHASENTRNFIQTLIHSDLATEPTLTNSTYGLQNYLMNDPAYMQLYCIDGGNEKLIHSLSQRIKADIRLNTAVDNVYRNSNGNIVVESLSQQQRLLDEYDYVIVALPHNHLKSIEYSGTRLERAVSRHIDYYNHPAHYLRMTLLFQRPYWRQWLNESFCMLDQFEGCCLYDEGMRQPHTSYGILGWLLGGNAAVEASHHSDDTLIEMALDSLPAALSHGRSLFIEGAVHRWIGAVSALPGGRIPKPQAERHCPEPDDHPNLFFVGDYLFDSTLNGVLDSAEYVAGWIAGLEAERPRRPDVSNNTRLNAFYRDNSVVRKGTVECQPML